MARIAIAVLAALLLLPSSAAAAKAPPLAATAQYKAFVEYVKKLDGLVGQPTTAAQKAKYETDLTAKRTAAAHKANALFKRASEEAKAEYDAKSKEQVEIVRRVEGDELEAVAAEFDGKIDRATGSYRLKLSRVDQGRQTFEAAMRGRIDALRTAKAQTTDAAQKAAIQERITALIERIDGKREESSQKRAELKAAFREQKQQIEAARVARADEIAAAAEAKIAKIAKHWEKAADDKKASLDAKRQRQLAYIEAKLEKGRADIASMPVAG